MPTRNGAARASVLGKIAMTDDIAHAARLLMGQYGDDGAIIAVMRAAEAAASGDIELADHWESVSLAIETAETRRPDA